MKKAIGASVGLAAVSALLLRWVCCGPVAAQLGGVAEAVLQVLAQLGRAGGVLDEPAVADAGLRPLAALLALGGAVAQLLKADRQARPSSHQAPPRRTREKVPSRFLVPFIAERSGSSPPGNFG